MHEQSGASQRGPHCDCFKSQGEDGAYEISFHPETQNTNCLAWEILTDLVERAAERGSEEFSPRLYMPPDLWSQIVTLPASISKLTSVKRVHLIGTHLVRIPPEIGDMASLQELVLYTSYRLHWMPFELVRCSRLAKTSFSTRSLYGNHKYRHPFPRLNLPGSKANAEPAKCSVCRKKLGPDSILQVWISLRVGTDVKHWKNLCKVREKYGANDLNGWLLKFIPYVRKEENEPMVHRNPVLELNDFSVESQEITGCTSNMLPTGISGAPVKCMIADTGKREHYQFVGGFAGVAQSENDLSLRPIAGWAITEGHLIDRLIERVRIEHEFEKTQGLSADSIVKQFHGYLPGDLWRFYSEFDHVSIKFHKPNRWGETSVGICSLDFVKAIWDPQSANDELKFLLKQGLIDNMTYDEREHINSAYSHLVLIGQGNAKGISRYVVGRDPELWFSKIERQSRGEVFRWTGDRTADAFTPVARTFTEWLLQLLDS